MVRPCGKQNSPSLAFPRAAFRMTMPSNVPLLASSLFLVVWTAVFYPGTIMVMMAGCRRDEGVILAVSVKWSMSVVFSLYAEADSFKF